MEIFRNIEVFVAVAKAQGFRPAALALGMPNSTVSRRIAELERDLGLRLFNRTTRRVELTESGRLYYDRCKRIIAEAHQAHEELAEIVRNPSGVIRASLPVGFKVEEITKAIADFLRLYPRVQFDLDLTPRQSDLVADNVDFAIRIGLPKEQGLITRKIAELPAALFASPGYVERHGTPAMPADLEHHACIAVFARPWVLYGGGGTSLQVEVKGPVIANNPTWLKQLALEGVGIFISVPDMMRPELEAGLLVQVLPDWHPAPVSVHAITETRLLPARVRLFLDFLTERLNPRPATTVAAPSRWR